MLEKGKKMEKKKKWKKHKKEKTEWQSGCQQSGQCFLFTVLPSPLNMLYPSPISTVFQNKKVVMTSLCYD